MFNVTAASIRLRVALNRGNIKNKLGIITQPIVDQNNANYVYKGLLPVYYRFLFTI